MSLILIATYYSFKLVQSKKTLELTCTSNLGLVKELMCAYVGMQSKTHSYWYCQRGIMVADTCSQNVKPTYAATVRNLKQLSCMRPKCFIGLQTNIRSRFVRRKLMGLSEMGSEGILLQVILSTRHDYLVSTA